jgi:hypothetical protein
LTSEIERIAAEQRARLVARLRMISKDSEGVAKALEEKQPRFANMLVG